MDFVLKSMSVVYVFEILILILNSNSTLIPSNYEKEHNNIRNDDSKCCFRWI
jgi:hypothetical protein